MGKCDNDGFFWELLHPVTWNLVNMRGYQKVCALMLKLFNGIIYHTKHLSCVKPICV